MFTAELHGRDTTEGEVDQAGPVVVYDERGAASPPHRHSFNYGTGTG